MDLFICKLKTLGKMKRVINLSIIKQVERKAKKVRKNKIENKYKCDVPDLFALSLTVSFSCFFIHYCYRFFSLHCKYFDYKR